MIYQLLRNLPDINFDGKKDEKCRGRGWWPLDSPFLPGADQLSCLDDILNLLTVTPTYPYHRGTPAACTIHGGQHYLYLYLHFTFLSIIEFYLVLCSFIAYVTSEDFQVYLPDPSSMNAHFVGGGREFGQGGV